MLRLPSLSMLISARGWMYGNKMHRKEYGGSLIFKSIQMSFYGMGDLSMIVKQCFVEHACQILSDMLCL